MKIIRATVEPVMKLGIYYPHLKKTDVVYETVCVGYRSNIALEYNDGTPFYDGGLFRTEKQAKDDLKNRLARYKRL